MHLFQIIVIAAGAATASVPSKPAQTAAPAARCVLVPEAFSMTGDQFRMTYIAHCPGAAPSKLKVTYGTAVPKTAGHD